MKRKSLFARIWQAIFPPHQWTFKGDTRTCSHCGIVEQYEDDYTGWGGMWVRVKTKRSNKQ